MNCNNHNHCCCEKSMENNFMSKKRKIEILEQYLECLDEKKENIKETINELKEENK